MIRDLKLLEIQLLKRSFKIYTIGSGMSASGQTPSLSMCMEEGLLRCPLEVISATPECGPMI